MGLRGLLRPKSAEIGGYRAAFVSQGPFKKYFSAGSRVVNEVVLVRVRDLMRRLDRQAEFEEYLELLRAEYKRKRNFMKLLEQIE